MAFKPNPNMLKVLEQAQSKSYDCTKAQMVEGVCGVSAFYSWLDTRGFVEWWSDETERWFVTHLPAVYAAVFKAARGKKLVPGIADRRLFLERFDKNYQPKGIIEFDAKPELLARLEKMAARASETKTKK